MPMPRMQWAACAFIPDPIDWGDGPIRRDNQKKQPSCCKTIQSKMQQSSRLRPGTLFFFLTSHCTGRCPIARTAFARPSSCKCMPGMTMLNQVSITPTNKWRSGGGIFMHRDCRQIEVRVGAETTSTCTVARHAQISVFTLSRPAGRQRSWRWNPSDHFSTLISAWTIHQLSQQEVRCSMSFHEPSNHQTCLLRAKP